MLRPRQPDLNTAGCPVPPPCRYKTSHLLETAGGQAQAGGTGICRASQVSGSEELKQPEEPQTKPKQKPQERAKQQLSQQKHSSKINEILITPL